MTKGQGIGPTVVPRKETAVELVVVETRRVAIIVSVIVVEVDVAERKQEFMYVI